MGKVIILENLNFEWNTEDIDKVCDRWKEGKSLIEIAGEVNRSTDEAFLLLMHLSMKGRIKKREGNIYGSKVRE